MHIELKHIICSFLLAVFTALLASQVFAQPYLTEQLTEIPDKQKDRDTDLIKAKIELEKFLIDSTNNTVNIEVIRYKLQEYCRNTPYKYKCKFENEKELIALEVVYNDVPLWRYGIVWNGERFFLIKEE